MRLYIRHVTAYYYSEPVFLEPHYLRLVPLQRPYLSVENFKIKVDPVPAGCARTLDIFDNPTEQAWFNDMYDNLCITAEMTVHTRGFNPFEFLQHPLTHLRSREIYSKDLETALGPFLDFRQANITQEIEALLAQLKEESNHDILKFITLLLDHIYQEWDHQVREHADVWDPQFCYEQKKGSCRDLAWMMINMLRSVGLASRFVSGYSFNPELEEGHELHAWLEVLIPGGGWIGVDPGLGLFANDHFVPLAVGSKPKHTMPVTGVFRGSATASLESQLEVKKLEG